MDKSVLKEKLAELILAIINLDEKSKKACAELDYMNGTFNRITIRIRKKEHYEVIENRELYIEGINAKKMDEVIAFINNYDDTLEEDDTDVNV